MFRRPATRTSDAAKGYALAGLVKTDANENQTYVIVMELAGDGSIVEVAINDVKFTDGSPVEIPVV